jgi:hypothetical protein
MYDIIIGRTEEDRAKFGTRGTVFLGRHYVKMGQTESLSNNIMMDVTRSHVLFICGKRGSGKSFTMGAIAEGMADLPSEIKENIAVLIMDTMGVYWTMKYPNQREADLLREWNLKSKPLDIILFTPEGFYKQYKEQGIPTDFPFSIKPSELTSADWCTTLGVSPFEPVGILIESVISKLKDEGVDYDIDMIIQEIRADEDEEKSVKAAAANRFSNSKEWGLFSKEGTPLKSLVRPGRVCVLDISCYAVSSAATNIRALVIGLVAKKLFNERMIARKNEEYEAVHEAVHYFSEEDKVEKKEMPLVWLIIDEAHEFLPNEGKTLATDPLVTILREGRQPGISLILASQQPGKIHSDVMTQSDIVLSHRITAKLDTDALGLLMQSYMREGLDVMLNNLPRVRGAAIILDDSNERMYPMRVRPRFTWHGGEAPTALHEDKKGFDFDIKKT